MKKERIFWGMFFILGAVFIIIGKLGYLSGINVLSLVVTVFLAVVFVKSMFSREFWGIFFSLAFLAIIYDEPLGITMLTPWTVLAAALLASIGCSMVFGHRRKSHVEQRQNCEKFDTVINEEDSERIYVSTSFASSIKYINSDDFKQAELKCSFGAMKVYFDNAVIQESAANVMIDLNFGAMEFYIPKEWNVVNNIQVSLGGVDEKNTNAPDGLHTLVLNGNTSFSGITIIYV